MKDLPIGISTFREIRRGNCYYVDKTRYIKKLSDEGKYYFMSRPRRFGKTLFADTLKEAFSGNKALFKGLYLENHWDWSITYPVVFLSFGGGIVNSRIELDTLISDILLEVYEFYGIEQRKKMVNSQFRDLLVKLNKEFGRRVVFIVDEYDKPILDNLTDRDAAYEIREGLKNLYSVIKDSDAYVKFAFLTGVSKFSKVSLFSGLNNLEDITLVEEYAGICGYSQNELESVFAERMESVDREKLKYWYNGYNFLGDPVYNPFDILLFLKQGQYRNYWFQSATPTFLIELLKEKKYLVPDLENLSATEDLLGSFDIDYMELETILFQTGYLTIKNDYYLGSKRIFEMCFPNHEVKMSLTDFILEYFVKNLKKKSDAGISLYRIVQSDQIDRMKDLFHSFFASIPHDWYRKNRLSGYEGYYASIFYCYFTASGFDAAAEDTTNAGRLDMSVKFEDRVYIFGFKMNQLSESSPGALTQIWEKKYHEKFVRDFKKIYLVGVEFDCEEREISSFHWEAVAPKFNGKSL